MRHNFNGGRRDHYRSSMETNEYFGYNFPFLGSSNMSKYRPILLGEFDRSNNFREVRGYSGVCKDFKCGRWDP